MKTNSYRIAVACLLLFFAGRFSYGQQAPINPDPFEEGGYEKRAQAGMKFLTISGNPRAAALGDAVTAMDLGAASMFYNPAGMAYLDGSFDVAIGTTEYIADITYNQAGVAFSPMDGRYGVFGLNLLAVDYGSLEGTIRADNERGFLETGSFSPTALAAGVSYARQLSDRFAVGGNVKYVVEDLGASTMSLSDPADYQSERTTQSNRVSTVAFDFGVKYLTGFRSLTFAMMTRNFSPAVRYEEEDFELPLALSVGMSMNLMDLYPSLQHQHALLVSVSGTTPRDFYEQVSLGAEYVFLNTVSLRAGYITPSDEQHLSLGGGVRLGVGGIDFKADYAYTRFGVFGSVQRLAFQLGF